MVGRGAIEVVVERDDAVSWIRDELFAVARRNPQLVKLEVLGRLPIRLLGAVLNDVPRGAAYGYYAYYSYYLPGYEAVDEDDRHASARVV